MGTTNAVFEIPRDNYFHACLQLAEVISSLEQGFDETQLDAGAPPSPDSEKLTAEVYAVAALLIDTFTREENGELATYLRDEHKMEFEDGYIFDPPSASPRLDVPMLRISKRAFKELFVYLMAYDRLDTDLDVAKHFSNQDVYHMILAQLHGTLYLGECHVRLQKQVNRSGAMQKAFRAYRRDHADEIEVEIWNQ